MNGQQRVVLACGIFLTAAMCVFPPWKGSYGRKDYVAVGYRLITNPPSEGDPWTLGGKPADPDEYRYYEIHTTRLLVQLLAVGAITAGGVFLLRGWQAPTGAQAKRYLRWIVPVAGVVVVAIVAAVSIHWGADKPHADTMILPRAELAKIRLSVMGLERGSLKCRLYNGTERTLRQVQVSIHVATPETRAVTELPPGFTLDPPETRKALEPERERLPWQDQAIPLDAPQTRKALKLVDLGPAPSKHVATPETRKALEPEPPPQVKGGVPWRNDPIVKPAPLPQVKGDRLDHALQEREDEKGETEEARQRAAKRRAWKEDAEKAREKWMNDTSVPKEGEAFTYKQGFSDIWPPVPPGSWWRASTIDLNNCPEIGPDTWYRVTLDAAKWAD